MSLSFSNRFLTKIFVFNTDVYYIICKYIFFNCIYPHSETKHGYMVIINTNQIVSYVRDNYFKIILCTTIIS